MTSVSKRFPSLLIIITINTMKGTHSDTTTTIFVVKVILIYSGAVDLFSLPGIGCHHSAAELVQQGFNHHNHL